MSAHDLPLWVTIPGSLLLVVGGLVVLVGSLGLLRLSDFYARLHGPSMAYTVGAGAVLVVSMLTSSALAGRPVVHEFLVALLLLTSAPVTSMMLVRAALHRDKARVK